MTFSMTRLRSAFGLLLWMGAVSGFAQTVSSIPTHPVSKTKIAGRTLLTLSQGDLDSPALSPDGTRLAYVSKFTKDKFDLADIFIRDLRTSRTVRMVDSQRMNKLMGEKADLYVTLRWVANNRLQASVADGNEGGMDVTFESPSGRVLTKKFWPGPGEDDDAKADDPKLKAAFNKIGGDPDSLLQAVVEEFQIGPHRLVLPVRMNDGHRELWSVNTQTQQHRRIVADLEAYFVTGGFRSGRWSVALLSNHDESSRSAQLLAWDGSKLFRSADLQLEYRPQDYGLDFSWSNGPFSILSLTETELGLRAFLLWDGSSFYYINDLDGSSKPTIDAAGQKICITIPEDGRHKIVLKELHLPKAPVAPRPHKLISRQAQN